jgi:hypothetical protein
MKLGGFTPDPAHHTRERNDVVKKLLALCLVCGLLGTIGCGDPPKPVKKDDKKATPAATTPAAEEKKDDKGMKEEKKEEKKPG